jgi:pepF/M3 family oligoendopeptidase
MNKWNLDSLYLDFDQKYQADVDSLDQIIEEFINFSNGLCLDDIEQTLEQYIDISERLNTLLRVVYAYPSLRSATDTSDKEALNYLDILSQKMTKLTKPRVLFVKWIKEIDLDAIDNEIVKNNLFALKESKSAAKYMLSDKEEVMFSRLNITGGASWGKLQSKLTSNLLVDIKLDGKEQKLPLTAIRNLAYSNDAEVRKIAYFAELDGYAQIEDAVAMALSNIKRQTNTMNDLRGYNNPVEPTLRTSRMQKETLDAMLSSMKKYLPDFRRYMSKKAEYLGYDTGLPFYDLFAPIGSSSKTYTYHEAQEVVLENFGKFSDKLRELAKTSFDNNWIDVEPRPGKRGGAFCSNLPSIKESRMLLNFDGSFSNVTTMAHELGHAYHGSVMCDNTPLNWSYPMPLAETASIICETIVKENIIKDLDKEEELTILEASLMDSNQVIVDIMSRYIFETDLFEKSENFALSASELKDMMTDAQIKTYGEGLDHNFLHPYMWLNKGHYYSTGLHFYNFPYAFGLLYAKGLYAQYLKNNDAFVEKFDKMLVETTKNSVENVAEMMNIDITKEDFWCESLEIIKGEIDRFCQLVDELK